MKFYIKSKVFTMWTWVNNKYYSSDETGEYCAFTVCVCVCVQ